MAEPMRPGKDARPLLLAMKGHPGTGKSTLARALGQQLRWPVLDKDDLKDVLDGRAPDSGGLAYEALFRIAQSQLLLGLNLIADSPLVSPWTYSLATTAAAEAGARVVVLETRCSDAALWQQRIEQRQALRLPPHHQTTWDGLQTYLAQAEQTAGYPISCPHLVVDTAAPLAASMRQALEWLPATAGVTDVTHAC